MKLVYLNGDDRERATFDFFMNDNVGHANW